MIHKFVSKTHFFLLKREKEIIYALNINDDTEQSNESMEISKKKKIDKIKFKMKWNKKIEKKKQIRMQMHTLKC